MTPRRPLFHGQPSLFSLPQQYPPQSVTLFYSGKVVQEFLETLFRRMLHHDDMREVAAEPVVMVGRQVILPEDALF